MMPAAISGTKGSADRPMRQVRPEALRQLMERLLVACGTTEEIAPVQADMHLEADLRGMDIQGLDHMFTLLEDVRAGHIDPSALPEVTQDLGATVLIDGHAGLGVPAAMLGIDVAVERARKHGSCVVGITNSSDIFMLGYYGDKLAREGLVAILATNSPPHTHAVGGSEAVIGTNPFVIAIPTPGPNPLVLDFATSHWAGSYFRQAAYHGEQLPEGLAFDPDGVPTRDPKEAYPHGAIAPLAGHKGYGLCLCLGILTGPLVGTPTGKGLSGGWDLGHLFIAIDPKALGDPSAFLTETQAHIDEVKSSRKAPGSTEIRVPGERLFATRERQLREGITMYAEVWKRGEALAHELAVEMPEDSLIDA